MIQAVILRNSPEWQVWVQSHVISVSALTVDRHATGGRAALHAPTYLPTAVYSKCAYGLKESYVFGTDGRLHR